MNIKYVAAAILGLACVSAAESPQNYSVYAGPDVTSDPILVQVYDRALATCTAEASTPPRGTGYNTSLYYNAALRACLSRHGFVDRGQNAYPTNSLF
ncbi:hypothetical protein G6L37_14055 [Agrobacterium rubi]|uniref:hypothetical protein n=1 Tax=Agrobacterium rubi TaxID=28099 RepID=UPI0015729816|nr:hypothetical protein [Agrobacterium rubi]NTF07267.1 hypothetical protein [Agrobacterium rubi]NTF19523.1 hypothetical protein [Agrobacterium rubi]NTF26486.1 hypothetical protein [Agrobacterium rubi]